MKGRVRTVGRRTRHTFIGKIHLLWESVVLEACASRFVDRRHVSGGMQGAHRRGFYNPLPASRFPLQVGIALINSTINIS